MSIRVSLIFDPHFGIRLESLDPTGYVWICDSEANRNSANARRKYLSKLPNRAPDLITTFEWQNEDDPTDNLEQIISTISEHHSWKSLDVYGLELGERVTELFLSESSVKNITKTDFGFKVDRDEK